MKYTLFLLLPVAWLLGAWPREEGTEKTLTGNSDETSFALLELFTSQGCSSCPPADAQLARLAERAEAGDPIFALSYHVDYWNYLGWEDPFSDARYSDRQRAYAANLGSRVYTPQLVVNGRQEMIGSRRKETEAAVAEALKAANGLSLAFTFERDQEQLTLDYKITGQLPAVTTEIIAVIAQQRASSSVKRGENRGRALEHVNVVRQLEQQTVKKNSGAIQISLPAEAADLSIVLFVQEFGVGGVLAAAKADLP